jgi:hypothetical protein
LACTFASPCFGCEPKVRVGTKVPNVTFWSQMAYAFWVCQWVLRILPFIFWMRLYFKAWCISMFFFSWETSRLFWAFYLHVYFVDLLISHEQYILIFPSYLFWQVYVGMWGMWPFLYGGLCPIHFLRELGFGGSIFVF